MNRRWPVAVAAFFCLVCTASAQVTAERLVDSAKEPQNWMTYSGDYSGKRFSALDQINTANAPGLVAKWVYQLGSTGKMETSPLEVMASFTPPVPKTAPLRSMRAPGGPSGSTSVNSR